MENKKESRTRIKVGLALGGGGWRGLAHVGVLKVLEKNNIPIDFIAGTSAGALIGGLYSYFGNSEDLEKFILKFGYRDLIKIGLDPKLKTGLIKGKKFIQYINDLTNHINIEDLKIPFRAVSSDLISGKSVYIGSGNLAEAIKNSGSVPVIFQPTCKEGMCLVDGGITENIPVRCVKDMGAEFIIAVNLNAHFFPMCEENVKSSSRIALVTTRVMLDQLSKLLVREADVLIEPTIVKKDIKFSLSYLLKFVKEKEIIKVGERETEKAIKSIKKKLK